MTPRSSRHCSCPLSVWDAVLVSTRREFAWQKFEDCTVINLLFDAFNIQARSRGSID